MLVKERIKLQPKTQTVQQDEVTMDFEKLVMMSMGPHFRPRKKQISIRMDVDLLEWFQAQPGKYQQLINKACRVFMQLNSHRPVSD